MTKENDENTPKPDYDGVTKNWTSIPEAHRRPNYDYYFIAIPRFGFL